MKRKTKDRIKKERLETLRAEKRARRKLVAFAHLQNYRNPQVKVEAKKPNLEWQKLIPKKQLNWWQRFIDWILRKGVKI